MKTFVTLYRYGSERRPGEGLRIGAARFVPRGVPRTDWSRLGYFDLWLPLLAPNRDLVEQYRHGKITFPQFVARYRREMKQKESAQIIELLAAMSLFQPVSLGCYCEDETKCHRSILRDLVATCAEAKHAALFAVEGDRPRFSSPVCYADWEENTGP